MIGIRKDEITTIFLDKKEVDSTGTDIGFREPHGKLASIMNRMEFKQLVLLLRQDDYVITDFESPKLYRLSIPSYFIDEVKKNGGLCFTAMGHDFKLIDRESNKISDNSRKSYNSLVQLLSFSEHIKSGDYPPEITDKNFK